MEGAAGGFRGRRKTGAGMTVGEKGQGEEHREYPQRETGNASGGRVAEGTRGEGQESAGSEASFVPLITDQFVCRKVFWFLYCLPHKGEQVPSYVLCVE